MRGRSTRIRIFYQGRFTGLFQPRPRLHSCLLGATYTVAGTEGPGIAATVRTLSTERIGLILDRSHPEGTVLLLAVRCKNLEQVVYRRVRLEQVQALGGAWIADGSLLPPLHESEVMALLT